MKEGRKVERREVVQNFLGRSLADFVLGLGVWRIVVKQVTRFEAKRSEDEAGTSRRFPFFSTEHGVYASPDKPTLFPPSFLEESSVRGSIVLTEL